MWHFVTGKKKPKTTGIINKTVAIQTSDSSGECNSHDARQTGRNSQHAQAW